MLSEKNRVQPSRRLQLKENVDKMARTEDLNGTLAAEEGLVRFC